MVAAKTYSMETAVRYVYGQGFGMDVSVLTEEEKEAIERARYCRKQLLRLKARRAAQEAGEADNSQILQQEEVEEWLANIELRLRQQSHKLGISPAELPIWIAPHMRRDLKIGNIASAAKAAAAAIRRVYALIAIHDGFYLMKYWILKRAITIILFLSTTYDHLCLCIVYYYGSG